MNKWGSWAQKPESIPEDCISEHYNADNVIAGAGVSGVSCALRAEQSGATVIVLEQSRLNTCCLLASESATLKLLKIISNHINK